MANSFDFAQALGKTGALALNAEIERFAQHGRVHPVLVEVAGVNGLGMPVRKTDFEAFSFEFLTMGKPKGLPVAIARKLAACCAAVREIMGMAPIVAPAEWLTPKAKPAPAPAAAAPAAAAPAAAAPAAQTAMDIVHVINSGMFSSDELDTILAACVAMRETAEA